MTTGVDKYIEKYIELRDRKAEIAERHKEELAPINEAMKLLEQALLALMQETGVDSVRAKGLGTAYTSEVLSLKVVDRQAALTHITDRGEWDLLQWSVNRTAYRERGEDIPGVEESRAIRVNFRRA